MNAETKADPAPSNTYPGRRRITRDEWLAEGTSRFGPKGRDWKFKCVRCGNVQSAHDFLALGMPIEEIPKFVFFSCIGRWTKERGCDWTLGGLFQIHTLEVIDEKGEIVPVFEFAD